jgi:enoyl-CoA hydratase
MQPGGGIRSSCASDAGPESFNLAEHIRFDFFALQHRFRGAIPYFAKVRSRAGASLIQPLHATSKVSFEFASKMSAFAWWSSDFIKQHQFWYSPNRQPRSSSSICFWHQQQSHLMNSCPELALPVRRARKPRTADRDQPISSSISRRSAAVRANGRLRVAQPNGRFLSEDKAATDFRNKKDLWMRVVKKGRVANVVLDRPEVKNCLRIEDYCAVADAFNSLSSDSSIHCIVLTGSGDSFCSGGDLGQIRASLRDGAYQSVAERFARAAIDAFRSIESCLKIVIAAVDGHCQAGGLSLALCSDLVIATPRSKFRVPEGLVGLADTFVASRLAPRIGFAKAKWLTLLADQFDAQQALDWGLINEICAEDQFVSRVESVASQLGTIAPNSLIEYKQAMNGTLPPFDINVMLRATESPFAIEGVTAFIEKRKPSWISN